MKTKVWAVGGVLMLSALSTYAKDSSLCKVKYVEMGQVTTCFYKGKTLAQAYSMALKNDPKEAAHLKTQLPIKNITYQPANREYTGVVSVDYTWPTQKKMVVSIMYEGGDTSWTFTEQSKGTQVVYAMFAD